jgi:glucose-6-phosphate isomerase
LSTEFLHDFINKSDIANFENEIIGAHEKLHHNSNSESDFKGWVDLPLNYNKNELERIKKAAENVRKNSDILVVIGIGGSYLGARGGIEFLNSSYYNYMKKDAPDIFFIGNSMSSNSVCNLLKICENKRVSLNVISKSGTTTEPAIAFRVFKEFMEKKYGKSEARKRIYCTTDSSKGALKEMALDEGYECFEIPSNIGGRYSVLTAVGLFPLAVSGAAVEEILRGTADAYNNYMSTDLETNDCYKYAVLRNIFYKKGKAIEMIAGYEPRLNMFFEWWKQLFGESEGKNGKGIFPASAIFSTDLHSLGQFIQEGSKILFETIIKIKTDPNSLILKNDEKNLDGINYLAGKSMEYVNSKAFEATVLAHTEGGAPNIVINVDKTDEYNLGYLIYFFEKSCAIFCYLAGVNPFNQPGVEAYKRNMFKLLGKPGC